MAKVTIIEDKEDIRNGIKNLINASGIHICDLDFENAEDAIKLINDKNTDAIFMDIELPGISGIEATSVIKNKFPQIQIIIMTVYEDADKIFKSLKSGATGYLLKTASPSKIIESIDEVLEGGSPMSQAIARMVVSSFNPVAQRNEEMDTLSKREKELLESLSKGYRYKEIADKLFISTNTVRTHIRNIYEKLQVRSRTEAINKMNNT